MRVASLCTGYGGLDLAIGGELVWCSEIDPDANKVITHRFPGVPNLGDLRAIDNPPEVDVLTAGFPCQPVSQAGRRKGTNDERWLWDDIEVLLGRMARPPRHLLLENVRGLLTANGGEAMARVVQGLARLGYLGSYRLVAASDVGACHRRERVFIVATHASYVGHEWGRPPRHGRAGLANSGVIAAHGDSCRLEGRPKRNLRQNPREPASQRLDAERSGLFGPYWPAVARWERVVGRPAPDPTVADADGRSARRDARAVPGSIASSRRTGDEGADQSGVAAGSARLNPRFVEWMMGLPDGWVCDVPGLSRTAQLRILGNGVVPQQARAAWEMLLP